MGQKNPWLQSVTSIVEETPYRSCLAADCDSNSDDETVTIYGITIFRLVNGELTFRFFAEVDDWNFDLAKAFGKRRRTLRISSLDFEHPVLLNSLSVEHSNVQGVLCSEFFGKNDAQLSGATVQIVGLPRNWRGTENWAHYQVLSTEGVQKRDDGTLTIPNGRTLGMSTLGGFKLKSDGWTASVREIQNRHKTDSSITHLCNLTRENGPLTGETVQEFLDVDLIPFLAFVFGQKIRFHTMLGYLDGRDVWVKTWPQSETPPKTRQENWFLRSAGYLIDLSPLFERFYRLAPDVKKHWRKVIDQYSTSEEVMGTLMNSPLAASVSFAALEGLVRAMINTYPRKDEWLKDDLSLKRGKSIIDAIEFVAKKELCKYSSTFRNAAEQISKIRNATFHTDLTSEDDPANAYFRWNASQALVEILLLSRMGLESIPNRTSPGDLYIKRRDILSDVRKGQLSFE